MLTCFVSIPVPVCSIRQVSSAGLPATRCRERVTDIHSDRERGQEGRKKEERSRAERGSWREVGNARWWD